LQQLLLALPLALAALVGQAIPEIIIQDQTAQTQHLDQFKPSEAAAEEEGRITGAMVVPAVAVGTMPVLAEPVLLVKDIMAVTAQTILVLDTQEAAVVALARLEQHLLV
jgi:hypothetical protein